MKLQKQLHRDDCLMACICSLLDWDLAAAPRFEIIMEAILWNQSIQNWLNENGWFLIGVEPKSLPADFFPEDMIIIASGISGINKDWNHAVLWQNGKLFFDPSPQDCGIVGEPNLFEILVKIIKESE